MRTGTESAAEAGAARPARRAVGLWILLALAAAGLVLVLPLFDLAFNDDWVYVAVTKYFYETGTLASTGFEATPVTLQALLGAAALTLAGGFSFHALHVVTLLLATAGAAAFYFHLKALGFDEARSSAGCLVLALNPIYFVNSFTFMTDVPSVSLAAIALYLLDRGAREQRDLLVFLGILACIAGWFVRLFDILVAVAFLVWVVANPAERRRLSLRRILVLFALPLLSAWAWMAWWRAAHPLFVQPYSLDPLEKANAYLGVLLTLGFFVLPISIPWLLVREGWRRGQRRGWLVGGAAVLAALLLATGRTFPFLGNQITAWGMYAPGEFIAGMPEPLFPRGLLLALTGLSLVATAALLSGVCGWLAAAATDGLRSLRQGVSLAAWDAFAARHLSDGRAFLHLFSLLYLASLCFVTLIFDRYLLFLIPSAVVLALDLTRSLRFPTRSVAAGLAGLFAFSVFLGADVIAWNRAVWAEAQALMKTGVFAREIDAGWAWAGYRFLTEPPVPRERLRRTQPWMNYYGDFAESNDNYLFSFSPGEEGYRAIKEIRYRGLPFGRMRSLYLLQPLPERPGS